MMFDRLKAYENALALMDLGVEPVSAFKQAASDEGLPYGDLMALFVDWAEARFYGGAK